MIDPPSITPAEWRKREADFLAALAARLAELPRNARGVGRIRPGAKAGGRPRRPVVSDRGERWPDAWACAEDLGVARKTVGDLIYKGRRCKGRVLRYEDQ